MLEKSERRSARVPEALMTEISLRFEPPFARVVLNRPERRNAITRAMWRALPAIRAAIEAREDLLVTLVEGEGAHFSAGADIAELGDIYRDATATRDFGDAMQNGLKALMDLDRPTIAVIRGVAIGAGLGLALACDLRFCAADAHLAITPARLGLIYGHAETRRLVELVGPSRAKDLLFTARRIETDEALAIGLIDRRIEAALQETVLGYARGLAELSQISVRGLQARGRRHRRRHDPRDARLSRADRGGGLRPRLRRRASGVRGQADGEIHLSRPDRAAGAKLSPSRPDAGRLADRQSAVCEIRLQGAMIGAMPNDVKPSDDPPAYVDPVSGQNISDLGAAMAL